MSLRSFVFTSDGGTSLLLRQMLADLSVEAESSADAMSAAEKITNQTFQIVIIDWDKQPEAGVLLTTARERKAAERPITLALISDEKSVPGALQAGANSILRKPIVLTQAKDTLTTARDLIRAKQESAAGVPHPVAHPPAAKPAVVALVHPAAENSLRGGDLLPSFTVSPGAQFQTESEKLSSPDHSIADLVVPLKDLEPVAAAVPKKKPEPPPEQEAEPSPTMASEPEGRGLEWYLKNRVSRPQPTPQAPPEAALPAPARKPQNPDLVGYDNISAQLSKSAPRDTKDNTFAASSITTLNLSAPPAPTAPAASRSEVQKQSEQQAEAELFAYMDGERPAQRVQPAQSGFHFSKKAILIASGLAACAILAAPQAPWHPQLRSLWRGGQKTVHAWLNPQPVTTPPQPAAHEDFGRAGDEYKLPVAEPIPDATTDPSQIQVVPVVDPTAKKPNDSAANQSQMTVAQPDPSAATSGDPSATSTTDTPITQAPQVQPQVPVPQVQTPQVQPTQQLSQTVAAPVQVASAKPSPVIPQSLRAHSPDPFKPSPPTPQLQPVSSPSNVPSSLKSHMVSMTPESSGNKAPETALPSIEPVNVSESAERALISDQPAIAYPESAKGQQGTVVLQVLIGRDGTVQDAKFLQGSFLFARAAIDGVKPWKFKPYIMNGRPVQVQTSLTLKFRPGQ